MLSWVGQAIIVVQTHFHEKVVLKELSVEYMFGKWRNSPLMGVINITLGMHMHKLSSSTLSVGLLEARRAWRRTTMIGVHPIVTRGSTFRVFVLCMDVTME
jgi:hypothetical protein